jgi:hypothetical protein
VVFCVRELHTVLLRRKGGIILLGVNEITLRLYRETMRHLESKERLGKTCVPRHGYNIRGPALSTESESRYIDTLNTNINIRSPAISSVPSILWRSRKMKRNIHFPSRIIY